MSKFLKTIWPTIRRTGTISTIHFILKIQSLNKIPLKIQNLPLFKLPVKLAFLYPFFRTLSRKQLEAPSNFDIEKKISQSIRSAEGLIFKGSFDEARSLLNAALKLAEENQAFGNIVYIFDLLTTVTFATNGLMATEDTIATFIEKLQQIGYPEDHNNVVKFKLKLARLYQAMGNREMAEYGYRDCINIQENKLKKNQDLDEASNLIYINSLFWYGKLLQDHAEFVQAKSFMKKSLLQIEKSNSVTPSQTMVVLYHNAVISEELKEFDDALSYLYKAIEICLNEDKQNPDLPFYVVKVGAIHLLKGIFDVAEYWCQTAKEMAKQGRNKTVEDEACACLLKLKTVKPTSQVEEVPESSLVKEEATAEDAQPEIVGE